MYIIIIILHAKFDFWFFITSIFYIILLAFLYNYDWPKQAFYSYVAEMGFHRKVY